MKELDDILQLRRDINSIDDRMTELKQSIFPKPQIISDMPRGGGERKNGIEEYIIKFDRLERKKNRLCCEISNKWSELEKTFPDHGITEAQGRMLFFRFFYGMSWRCCVERMEEEYPQTTWNEPKLFRIYRKIIYKFKK